MADASRYGFYPRTQLSSKKRTYSVRGAYQDTGKFFRCWNCGAICNAERDTLAKGGLQSSNVTSLSNISLLLHMDGDNASTTFTDSSPVTAHTVTSHGASISTDQYKFGDSSGYFNGATYLSIPDHADFDLSGGYWAIDFWARPGSSGPVYFNNTDASNYFYIGIDSSVASGYLLDTSGLPIFDTTGALIDTVGEPYNIYRPRLSIYEDGSEVVSVTADYRSLQTDVWSHVLISEWLNTYRIYVDGKLLALVNDSDRPADYTGYVYLSGAPGVTESMYTGYLDEFRVSKSVRHLDRNFSVPTGKYDTDKNELNQNENHWENSAYYPKVKVGCWFCGANYK